MTAHFCFWLKDHKIGKRWGHSSSYFDCSTRNYNENQSAADL